MAFNESGSFFNHGKENISAHPLSTALEPSSPPLPPPPPPPPYYSHLSHDPSSAPSDNVPCPSYSTCISGQPYAASHTTGGQIDYQPPLQHSGGVPYGTANQQVLVVDPQPQVILVGQQPRVSMVGAIILSCVVFWLFGWLCGGIAFVLALIGQNSASAGDRQTAIRLRNASYGVSIAGVVVAIIIIIVFVSLSSAKYTYDYSDKYRYNYSSNLYYRC